MKVGVAFDFDGVLYDTYSLIPRVLAEAAVATHTRPEYLMLLEEIAEAMGAWNRRLVYRAFSLPEDIHDKLWDARVAYAKPTGVHNMIPLLRGLGLHVYIVCGADATVSEKRRRVEASGVHLLVDDVLVYEPGRLADTLQHLLLRENLQLLVYVDDKPGNTCTAARVENVKTVWFVRRPPYPMQLAWSGGGCGKRAYSADDLLQVILDEARLSQPQPSPR